MVRTAADTIYTEDLVVLGRRYVATKKLLCSLSSSSFLRGAGRTQDWTSRPLHKKTRDVVLLVGENIILSLLLLAVPVSSSSCSADKTCLPAQQEDSSTCWPRTQQEDIPAQREGIPSASTRGPVFSFNKKTRPLAQHAHMCLAQQKDVSSG